jgi:hypothetical protein
VQALGMHVYNFVLYIIIIIISSSRTPLRSILNQVFTPDLHGRCGFGKQRAGS